METKITTRYEHRTIKDVILTHCQPQCGQFTIPAGFVVKKVMEHGRKFNFYRLEATRHEIYEIPTEDVGVFKITRTVTEKEERIK